MQDNIHGTLATPPVLTPWGYFPSYRVTYDPDGTVAFVILDPEATVKVRTA